jgi:predicted Zn-dependent protease
MTRAAVPLLSLALGVLLLGADHQSAADAARHSSAAGSMAPDEPATVTGVEAGSISRAFANFSSAPTAPDDDRLDIRRRVRDGEPGTYIGDILQQRDSSLARWADRNGIPLTVWVQPRSNVADFGPGYVAQVRQAFQDWGSLNLPLNFSFVADSAEAEVHVTWIDRFDRPISGRTRWTRDDEWVITDASIVLAMHHHQGELLDEESMRAMALHEIGHLLGLDHTKDTLSIMAPKVRVRQLSNADRATVRLLYALPSGPVR